MSDPLTEKSCIVPRCDNTSINNPEKVFIPVPCDTKIRRQWLNAMNRHGPIRAKTCLYCCEDHFNTEDDMENYMMCKMMGGRLRLKKGVIPHNFECQKYLPEDTSTMSHYEKTSDNSELLAIDPSIAIKQEFIEETHNSESTSQSTMIPIKSEEFMGESDIAQGEGTNDQDFIAKIPIEDTHMVIDVKKEIEDQSADDDIIKHHIKALQEEIILKCELDDYYQDVNTSNPDEDLETLQIKEEPETDASDSNIMMPLEIQYGDESNQQISEDISPNNCDGDLSPSSSMDSMNSKTNKQKSKMLQCAKCPKMCSTTSHLRQHYMYMHERQALHQVKSKTGLKTELGANLKDQYKSLHRPAMSKVRNEVNERDNVIIINKTKKNKKQDLNNHKLDYRGTGLINCTKTYYNRCKRDLNIKIHNKTDRVLSNIMMPLELLQCGDEYDNPEEILPNYNNTFDNSADMFQLNSITGNVLPLEQQTYDLLRARQDAQVCICTNESDIKQHNICPIHSKIKKNYNKIIPCPKCSKICTSNKQFENHSRAHYAIERHALSVLKGLNTKAAKKKCMGDIDLSKYKLEDVSGRGEFSCKFCGKAYSMKKCMLRHQNMCAPNDSNEITEKPRGSYLCSCGKSFRRQSSLQTCLKSHDIDYKRPDTVPCNVCMKTFKDMADVIVHKRKYHTKRFHCKFCPMDFSTNKLLLKHLRKHKKVKLMEYKVISEVMNGEKTLECFMCTKTYSELSELKSHVICDHKEPYTCPHCEQNFSKIFDFASHTKSSHPQVKNQSVLDVLEAFSKLAQSWKCDECELHFDQPEKLALHRAEKHSVNNTSCEVITPQFLCTDCSRVFFTARNLSTHRRMVHRDEENGAVGEIIDYTLMCIHCRKICHDHKALTSHMRFHSPDRKYVCKYCDFRFATIDKRKSHALIHTGDMKFVCFICEYRCTSENRLTLHKQSQKHLSMKDSLESLGNLEKDAIDKEESSSSEDKNTDKMPGSDVEASVPCNVCGENFPNENDMLVHKEMHPFIEIANGDEPTRIFFK